MLEPGAPPGNDHDHEVGLCVEPSVKVIVAPVVVGLGLAVKLTTGGVETTVTVAVPDICVLQPVVAFVAKTLKVVVVVKLPVGKVSGEP